MSREVERLHKTDIEKLGPGLHADGNSLYLRVDKNSAGRSWIVRVTIGGRKRDIGIGSVKRRSLATARKKRDLILAQVIDNIDPLAEKLAIRQQRQLDHQRAVSFKFAAESYIASHAAGWRRSSNSEHVWRATLGTYAFPILGDLPVGAIDTGLVTRVLEPIWTSKNETASRLRSRIENVLDFAKVKGWRSGDNPAAWVGHLDHILPAPADVRPKRQHAALPFAEMPQFMAALRKETSFSAAALEFAILCASRIGEVTGMTWGEVNFKDRVWTVPPTRMKSGTEHRVPLSDAAMAVLARMEKLRTGDLVFPRTSPLSVRRALAPLAKGMTVHGFRSALASWSAECTSYQFEVREMALAHQVGSAVERAYQRSDLFDRRRRLMADWADFCGGKAGGDVVPLRSRAGS